MNNAPFIVAIACGLAFAASPAAASSISNVDEAYMAQFEQAGQRTFVLESYDPNTKALVDRVVEPLAQTPEVRSPVERVYNGRVIRSYGLIGCPKQTVIYENQRTDCTQAARDDLTALYGNASVILCQAFAGEKRPIEANCYTLRKPDGSRRGPGSVDDRVVFLGFADLAKNAKGELLRPDLARTQKSSVDMGLGIHGVH